MKSFCVSMLLFMASMTNIICQNIDSIMVISVSANVIYPLISDENIEKRKKTGVDCHFIYPLLILNNVIIREEKQVDCFRNIFEFMNIKSIKRITKAEAEKRGIPNVPKDGVLFVTTKKGYYFDFSCE